MVTMGLPIASLISAPFIRSYLAPVLLYSGGKLYKFVAFQQLFSIGFVTGYLMTYGINEKYYVSEKQLGA